MQNQKTVKIGNIDVANDKPFTLFAGMNVLESRGKSLQIFIQRHKLNLLLM
jgi:2-dehydro-3-deoxyphosphooctonate aldolase (KDO 8-P synthase)